MLSSRRVATKYDRSLVSYDTVKYTVQYCSKLQHSCWYTVQVLFVVLYCTVVTGGYTRTDKAIQYSTVQPEYSTVQYSLSTVQYSTA